MVARTPLDESTSSNLGEQVTNIRSIEHCLACLEIEVAEERRRQRETLEMRVEVREHLGPEELVDGELAVDATRAGFLWRGVNPRSADQQNSRGWPTAGPFQDRLGEPRIADTRGGEHRFDLTLIEE